MQASVYNLKRMFRNMAGQIFGHEHCIFCGDRANWKPWTKLGVCEYEMPVCRDCFGSQSLTEIMNAIKADIIDNNNFCLSFRADPIYSDADEKLIMNAVTVLKSQGAQG